MSGHYEGREQSQVKHIILRRYLERFARIIGQAGRWSSVTYVDCFSGPWNTHSSAFEDSSFAIALAELRRARQTCREQSEKKGLGRPDLGLRCYFIEEDPKAYAKLRGFAEAIDDATVRTCNARLCDCRDDIIAFVKEAGDSTFPFIFIDPTGWTGFELEVIEPLLKLRPGEVLINFMTSFVRRFISSADPSTRRSFEQTFGAFLPSAESLAGLAEEDLDDALVAAYSRLVADTGPFPHVCSAIVLHPQKARSHFHLIYATRHPRGVQVFKDAERTAMEEQERLRGEARERARAAKDGPSLFAPEEVHDFSHYIMLRERYCARSKAAVRERLEADGSALYDSLWLTALKQPLTWESDLKEWINEWQRAGKVSVSGLTPPARSPKCNSGIRIKLLKSIDS